MSIQIKPNQALAFGPEGPANLPCNCGGSYCQPVQEDDIIFLQGTISEEGSELSVLSDFTYQPGWFAAAGKIYGKPAPLQNTQAISNQLNLQSGNRYSVYIDATTIKAESYVEYGDVEFNGAHLLVFPGDSSFASLYHPGDTIYITGTVHNNGIYTVASCSLVSGSVIITTNELNTTEGPTTATIIKPGQHTPEANEGFRFKFNGSYLELPVNAPDTTGQATSTSYLLHWYVQAGTITDDHLRIESSTPEQIIIINHIGIRRMSRVGIAVYEGNNIFLQADNPTGVVTYFAQNTFVNNEQGFANITYYPIPWTAVINFATFTGRVYGCSRFAFYDSSYMTNLLKNGSFTTGLNDWVPGNYWTWDSGKALYDSPNTAGYLGDTLRQNVTIPGGGIYRLTFTIADIPWIFDAAAVWYRINGQNMMQTGVYWNGTFTADIDLTAYADDVDLRIEFGEQSQVIVYHLTNVSLVRLTPDKNNVSNCIDTQAHHPCTLLFNAYNYDNAFGFNYTNPNPTMQHFLRVYAKMDVTAYPEETETPYIFSNNNRVLMFARRDKEYTIFIGDAPVHIHDCLSHMRLHDDFKIGTGVYTGLQFYVKESTYELNRRKTSSLKQATFTVREKQGIASNFPCR